MAGVWAKSVVLVLAGFSSALAQDQDLPRPTKPAIGPQLFPTWILLPEPPLPLPPDAPVPAVVALPNLSQVPAPPSLNSQPPPKWIVSPDAPIPDLATLQVPPDKSKSIVKRALDRAKPNCIDAILHTCWSSPPGDDQMSLPEEDREFANDMEIGNYAYRLKNYRGAELRFRHALEYKPGDPEATFRLAESLDKLGRSDEAKQEYQAYLMNQPEGGYAERAQKALRRLSNFSAAKH